MGVRIGDTVTVTVTGKVTWEGDKVIEVEMPGQEDGHLIFRANAKITKVE